nr:hypothetical protein [Tanacetum cinerariifolium]
SSSRESRSMKSVFTSCISFDKSSSLIVFEISSELDSTFVPSLAHIMEMHHQKLEIKVFLQHAKLVLHLLRGKNTNQVTISQLFQRKITKDDKKANLKQQPTTTTPPATSSFQSPFFPSPPMSTPQTEGELIKKDKVKEVMASKDAEEKETESDSESDYANLADFMVESSKKKKLKKFDFVTEGGE